MAIVTRLVRVVTYYGVLPPLNSWARGLVILILSYVICRFREHKHLSRHRLLVAFACYAKHFEFAGFFHLPLHNFSGISENSEQENILQTIK